MIDIPTVWTARRGSNSNAISAAAQKEALIVDDDVRARELLSELCRGQGFEVATSHDGRAAIAPIALESEAICRDHYRSALARADGFDVLRAARDANPSVLRRGASDFRLAEPGGGEAGGFGEREAETQKLKIEDRGPRTD